MHLACQLIAEKELQKAILFELAMADKCPAIGREKEYILGI